MTIAERMSRAESLIACERFDDARALLGESARLFADNPWPSVLLAKIALRQGDRTAARELIVHALSIASDTVGVHLTAARALLEANETNAADAVLAEAQMRFPDDPAVLALCAERASASERWSDAWGLWNAVIDRTPESTDAVVGVETALAHLAPTDRAVVVVYGNCQAEFLCHLLNLVPALSAQYFFVTVINHGYVRRDPDAPITEDAARASVVWEQYEQNASVARRERMRAFVPAEAPVFRYPWVSGMSLWPFACLDNRPEVGRRYEHRFGDRVAMEVATMRLPGARAFERYMQLSRAQMPNVRRLLERERALLGTRDTVCDVHMGDFMFGRVRTEYDFWTWGNASSSVMFEFARQLFACSAQVLPDFDGRVARQLSTVCAMCPGQSPCQLPIHPAVIEQLELTYVDANSTYLWFGSRRTFEEHMTEYITLDAE